MPLGEEARQLKQFLDAIVANPRDLNTRLVYADWLEERDEIELAEQQRKWNLKLHDAKEWLKAFAKQYADGDYEGMVAGALEGDYVFSDDDGPWAARQDDFWENIQIVAQKEVSQLHKENASFTCGC